jgi:tetratricopeptide (TPR) repeat protein
MAKARGNPAEGYAFAGKWLTGGEPAQHCQAIALIGLKRFAEAGQQLELLANKMHGDTQDLRAETFAQAAEAWSENGQPVRAEADLDQSIQLAPEQQSYRIDRATARAAEHNYTGAIEDLSSVIAAGSTSGEVFAYRAAAYRLSGDLKAAMADAESAVKNAPTLPEAWLERANARGLSGDADGAQQDWQKVVELAPGSPAADAATRNLDALKAQPNQAGSAAPPAKP